MKTLTIELSDTDAVRIAKIATLLETTPEKYARWELISNIGAMSWDCLIGAYWQDKECGLTDKPSHQDAAELVAELTQAFEGKTLKQLGRAMQKRDEAWRRELDKVHPQRALAATAA